MDAALSALAVAEERISVRSGEWLSRFPYAYSRIGHRDEAVRLLNELEGLLDETSRVSPGHQALAHLAAGNYEEILGWYHTFIEIADRPQGGTGL